MDIITVTYDSLFYFLQALEQKLEVADILELTVAYINNIPASVRTAQNTRPQLPAQSHYPEFNTRMPFRDIQNQVMYCEDRLSFGNNYAPAPSVYSRQMQNIYGQENLNSGLNLSQGLNLAKEHAVKRELFCVKSETGPVWRPW